MSRASVETRGGRPVTGKRLPEAYPHTQAASPNGIFALSRAASYSSQVWKTLARFAKLHLSISRERTPCKTDTTSNSIAAAVTCKG